LIKIEVFCTDSKEIAARDDIFRTIQSIIEGKQKNLNVKIIAQSENLELRAPNNNSPLYIDLELAYFIPGRIGSGFGQTP